MHFGVLRIPFGFGPQRPAVKICQGQDILRDQAYAVEFHIGSLFDESSLRAVFAKQSPTPGVLRRLRRLAMTHVILLRGQDPKGFRAAFSVYYLPVNYIALIA
jgi:hypothetical protein